MKQQTLIIQGVCLKDINSVMDLKAYIEDLTLMYMTERLQLYQRHDTSVFSNGVIKNIDERRFIELHHIVTLDSLLRDPEDIYRSLQPFINKIVDCFIISRKSSLLVEVGLHCGKLIITIYF